MELELTEKERAFRDEARAWLQEQLSGPFKHLRGRGASGDQESFVEERIEWGKVMGAAGRQILPRPSPRS